MTRHLTRGATVWATWAYNSKPLTSPVPVSWGAGFSYQAPIAQRKNDIVSVGLIRAQESRYRSPANAEDLLEFNYQWTHSRYLTIIPHAQYLWWPDRLHCPNATILGIQVALTL